MTDAENDRREPVDGRHAAAVQDAEILARDPRPNDLVSLGEFVSRQHLDHLD